MLVGAVCGWLRLAKTPKWRAIQIGFIAYFFLFAVFFAWKSVIGYAIVAVAALGLLVFLFLLVAKFKLIRSRLTKSGFTLTTRSLYEMAILGDEWHWRLLDAQVPAESGRHEVTINARRPQVG